MAVIDMTSRGAPGAGLLHRVLGRVAQMRDSRRTAAALSKLTERELDDIGLSRADVAGIAAGDLIR